MKLKIFVILFVLGTVIFVFSQKAEKPFASAADFPRGALIYVQVADLPTFVKQLNESKLKQNYLESENFAQFQNRHLALKLASRWDEFNAASGFPIDLDTFAGASETRAAIAVYDIARLDVVFIAPVNDKIFAASQFFQNQTQFEETELEDGTVFYSKDVEADRGRQRQKLVFANANGRFVLATSEKLLLQTLANITEKSPKNSLADEPAFEILSKKIAPHAATVWLDQVKLNEDYYFKHYWLAGNLEDLKKFRAGMFDFEMTEDKWTEHREFLLTEDRAEKSYEINATEADILTAMIPSEVPFFKILSVANDSGVLSETIENALYEKVQTEQKSQKNTPNWQDYSYENYYASSSDSWHDYAYLDNDYEQNINNAEDAGISEEASFSTESKAEIEFKNELQNALAAADPKMVLTAQSPQILPAPLFAEFRKAVVILLDSSQNFNRENLENILAARLKNQLTTADSTAKLDWETKTENNKQWRELNLPQLGRGICYSVENNELVLSNSAEFLKTLIFNDVKTIEKQTGLPFKDMTVIRLSEHEKSFEGIMNLLAKESNSEVSNDFFTGNIGSLLAVGADVSRIEIRRNSSGNFLHEEINFVFKPRNQ